MLSDFVHFVQGSLRGTPCERAYLHGDKYSIFVGDVTCPICLESPMFLDEKAALLEAKLGGAALTVKERMALRSQVLGNPKTGTTT